MAFPFSSRDTMIDYLTLRLETYPQAAGTRLEDWTFLDSPHPQPLPPARRVCPCPGPAYGSRACRTCEPCPYRPSCAGGEGPSAGLGRSCLLSAPACRALSRSDLRL